MIISLNGQKDREFVPRLPQKKTSREPHLPALQTHSTGTGLSKSKLLAVSWQQELPPQAPRGTNHDGKDTQDPAE